MLFGSRAHEIDFSARELFANFHDVAFSRNTHLLSCRIFGNIVEIVHCIAEIFLAFEFVKHKAGEDAQTAAGDSELTVFSVNV